MAWRSWCQSSRKPFLQTRQYHPPSHPDLNSVIAQAGLDFAAHWLETHTGPHLVGGLLAVLLEDQLESGVGQKMQTDLLSLHVSYIFV